MRIKIKGFNRVASYSGLLLAAFFGLITFPISLTIDSTEATVTPSTTTLTLSTSDISAEITPNNANGTFVASDPATVSVTTNNYSGYTLGITSSDDVNNTKLINTNDNTAYLTSISSASDPEEFNANNWGYLPSKLNGTANSAYQPAPTTTATTLEATNTANPTANEYTIKLGVKADYMMGTGTYENTFIITATANPVNYTITYNKNTTDTVTNMPVDQGGYTVNTSVALANNAPMRTGYTFLGWNTVSGGTGDNYQPGGTYGINQTITNNVTLYAQWRAINFDDAYAAAGKTKVTVSGNSYYKMQDMTTDICNTVNNSLSEQYTQLVDIRDNTIYNVGKLKDGKCWLRDNLALDLTNSTVKNNLTEANTDATATDINYLKNGGGTGTSSDRYAVNGVTSWTGDGSVLDTPLVYTNLKNTTYQSDGLAAARSWKYGIYYNICAATAGTACYSLYNFSQRSICPAGWRIPTGGSTAVSAGYYADYETFAKYYSGHTEVRTVLRLPLSGKITSSPVSQGSEGYFWSQNAVSGPPGAQKYLYIDSSSFNYNPASVGRGLGFSVRCIAR